MARRVLRCVLCLAILFHGQLLAQPGVRGLDMRGRLLDAVFKGQHEAEPYVRKMLLRFGDQPSQLTVVTYVGGATEIRRLELVGVNTTKLDEFIADAQKQNPAITPEQLASKLSVREARTFFPDSKVVEPLLRELERVRISPALGRRVPLDDYSEYEFVYDLWQESVHYTVVGPFDGFPQDELVKWMLLFRETANEWLKAAQAR